MLFGEFNFIADIARHIEAHCDHTPCLGGPLNNLIPTPITDFDDFRAIIFGGAPLDHIGGLRQHHRVIAHTAAGCGFEPEDTHKGAVPIDHALARIPKRKGARKAFQSAAQTIFSLLGSRDCDFGLGDILQDAVQGAFGVIGLGPHVEPK